MSFKPCSNCSLFSGLKIDFKKLICVAIKKATIKVAYILDCGDILLFTQPIASEVRGYDSFNERISTGIIFFNHLDGFS